MKVITLALAVLFTSLAMTAQSNTHIVMHQDGAFANADAFNGGTSLTAEVSRGTDFFTGQPTTFLFYTTFVDTPDGFTETFGSGTIPNDSFKGDDPAHLMLDVDTSQLTTIFATSCTFSFSTFTFTCSPAQGGMIDLEWRQSKFFSTKTTNDTQQTFFQARINSHVVSDTSSANIAGSFIGLDVTNGFAIVGVNHSSTVEIFRSN